MLRNHIKIYLRNLVRSKTFSAINILGLSVGFTSFLLIGLYVVDEFSFDRYHDNVDRIYMVITEANYEGQSQRWNGVANKVSPVIAKEIPQVEKSVRLFNHAFGNIAFLSSDSVKSSEHLVAWADPEIFDVLTFEFLAGDPKTCLTRPNTAVVSENSARKYFGTLNVLGKTLRIDNATDLEITGVYKNPPPASRFQHPVIASFHSHWFGQEKNQSWGNASFETYLLVQPGVDQAVLENKLAEMIKRNIPKDYQWYSLKLKPLRDAYIYSSDFVDLGHKGSKKGDISQIRILIALALIIILIAAVNYMNLSTAQSRRRFKEIGISKTLGATGREMAAKFYLETSVFVFISMVLGIMLSALLLPFFNSITGKFITASFLWNGWFWGAFMITWAILSLISGIYPALYLSAFSAGKVLKTSAPGLGGHATLRKGLVIVQFSVSIILIISTVILYQQLNFMRSKKLGYQPEQVVAVLTTGAENREQVLALKSEFDRMPAVLKSVRSQSFPGEGASGRSIPPLDGNGEGKTLSTVRTTPEILDVLGIELIAGKGLPESKSNEDTTIQVVLNKTAIDFLGISPEDAVKRIIQISGFGKVEVTGITNDFHFSSLHEPIGAYCFHNAKTETYNYILLKLQTQNLTATMNDLEATYKKIIPGAFEFTFLDQKLETLYQEDQQLAKVVFLFASLAIIIACLGLFALASYTTEQRTKEIGIRKVLGASVTQLTNMLSADFIRLVMISFLVAAPVGYLLMKEWLKGFAYRIEINPLIIILAGGISFLIAWLTVGFESMRAANSNPVNSLRNE